MFMLNFPSTQEETRATHYCEFGVSFDYIVSSRTAQSYTQDSFKTQHQPVII